MFGSERKSISSNCRVEDARCKAIPVHIKMTVMLLHATEVTGKKEGGDVEENVGYGLGIAV